VGSSPLLLQNIEALCSLPELSTYNFYPYEN